MTGKRKIKDIEKIIKQYFGKFTGDNGGAYQVNCLYKIVDYLGYDWKDREIKVKNNDDVTDFEYQIKLVKRSEK